MVASELFGSFWWFCLFLIMAFFMTAETTVLACREVPGWWKWATKRGRTRFKDFFSADKNPNKCVTSRARSTVCQLRAQWAFQAGSSAWPAGAQCCPSYILSQCWDYFLTSLSLHQGPLWCLFESLLITHWLLSSDCFLLLNTTSPCFSEEG